MSGTKEDCLYYLSFTSDTFCLKLRLIQGMTDTAIIGRHIQHIGVLSGKNDYSQTAQGFSLILYSDRKIYCYYFNRLA